MNDKCAPHTIQMSYFEFFQKYYAPQFKAVDLLLKCMDGPLTVSEAAAALHMTEAGVQAVMEAESVIRLDRDGFLTVMAHGSSAICLFYRRELECGSPVLYSPEDVAYIYGLQAGQITAICESRGITAVTQYTLPALLSAVPVTILC